jgi:hypothetical protein
VEFFADGKEKLRNFAGRFEKLLDFTKYKIWAC